MAKYPSRTGDDGYTGILGEGRLPKYDLKIETIGVLDEANAALGLARSSCNLPESKATILIAQRDLYTLMSEVAASKDNAATFRKIGDEQMAWIEKSIEELSGKVHIPNQFIIPGDSLPEAAMDLARTIIRRAERRVAELFSLGEIENQDLLRYLNRLSSVCYLLELLENAHSGNPRLTLAKEDLEL